jgi:DNA-binding CsgD family transcriptional regulator
VEIDELSRRFSRSTFTIEKQLQDIYAAFGVRSRTGLRDELHRRGLL